MEYTRNLLSAVPSLVPRTARADSVEPIVLETSELGKIYRERSFFGGLREVAADWREAWERMDLFPQEIIDAGNPVVILGRLHLRARGSGIEFDTPLGQVVWAERGLIVRDHFNNWDEALRVAGIPATAMGESRRATPV